MFLLANRIVHPDVGDIRVENIYGGHLLLREFLRAIRVGKRLNSANGYRAFNRYLDRHQRPVYP